MGIVSVVILLICPACTVPVVIPTLALGFLVAVCLWYICTGIASAFIYASFSASIRSDMPFFSGTYLARLIDTSCRRIEICYTM